MHHLQPRRCAVQVPDTLVGDALLDIILDPQESDGSGLLIGGCLTGAAMQGRGCAWQHHALCRTGSQNCWWPKSWS